jgi:hypothetical protein
MNETAKLCRPQRSVCVCVRTCDTSRASNTIGGGKRSASASDKCADDDADDADERDEGDRMVPDDDADAAEADAQMEGSSSQA